MDGAGAGVPVPASIEERGPHVCEVDVRIRFHRAGLHRRRAGYARRSLATYNGDNAGTASTEAIPYTLGTGPVEIAWSLDVRAAGHDRVASRNPITFDGAGNLYWKTSTGGGTGGITRIVSVSPDGKIRWVANDGKGNLHGLGRYFDATAAVIGKNAVYALGELPQDEGEWLFVAAYDKETGALLWQSELDDAIPAPDGNGAVALLTPVLHEGKLYVIAPDVDSRLPRLVFRLDASNGNTEWVAYVEEVGIRAQGQITLVPDAFGVGEHGLYFNGDSGNGSDGIPEVYGIRVLSNGAQIYTYSPETGPLAANVNLRSTGHGFYDVGCLEFDGEEIIAGGFNGFVIRYTDVGNGRTQSQVAYDDANLHDAFWGEYRIYGQLLKAPDGKIYYFHATTGELVALKGPGSPLPRFIRGDADGSGSYTIGDGIQILDRLFAGRPALGSDCDDTGDIDDDGVFTIGDAVRLFNYLFAGGVPPASPGDACGVDPTPDDGEMSCNATSPACR